MMNRFAADALLADAVADTSMWQVLVRYVGVWPMMV